MGEIGCTKLTPHGFFLTPIPGATDPDPTTYFATQTITFDSSVSSGDEYLLEFTFNGNIVTKQEKRAASNNGGTATATDKERVYAVTFRVL